MRDAPMKLTRDPEDWAREWGWISPVKARNDARKLRELAAIIRGAIGNDGGEMWARECERIAKRLDPPVRDLSEKPYRKFGAGR